MKLPVIFMGAGLLFGTLATYSYLHFQYTRNLSTLRLENEGLKTAATQAEQELASSREKIRILEDFNRQLSERKQTAVAVEATTPEAQEERPPQEQRDRSAEMRAFSERMIKRNLDRWTDSLKLTADQASRLNQLLQDRVQNGQQGGNPWSGLQEELLKVLTPEQKTEYNRIQTRESQARLELRVQTQLTQVQAMFDLTEAQKDQIFQKFAALEQSPAPASTPAAGSGPGNRNQARQALVQRRIEALQGILTPEQLNQYKKAQESNFGPVGGGR